MVKIATHSSATGEKSLWYTIPFIPFTKTQSKTLEEQYNAGCRLFDIKLKLHRNKFRFAQGLWMSEMEAEEGFNILNRYNDVLVTITYIGSSKNIDKFRKYISYIRQKYQMITYGHIVAKYGKNNNGAKIKYNIINKGEYTPEYELGFLQLNGFTWHSYLPIPWLWKKIYFNNPVFNSKYYTYVDFL